MERSKSSTCLSAIRAYLPASFALAILLAFSGSAQAQWATNGNDINNTNTGKVGVGTTAPGSKLEVQIDNAVADGIKVTDAGAAGKYLYLGDGGSHSGVFAAYIAGIGGSAWGLLLEGGVATDASNIPAVSVRGNIGYANLANSPIFTVAKSNGTELFRVGATGNVGIGTTAPGQLLTVFGSKTASYSTSGAPLANASIFNVNNTGSNNEYSTLQFQVSTDNTVNTNAVGYLSLIKPVNSSNAGDFGFTLRKADNSYGEVLRLQSSGNVGIGTSTPTAKLDVNGNANVTGNFNANGTITGGTIEAKYQDVAEWVPATHALPAGTVVTINPTQSNQVTASSTAYDTRVAGVISERPGLALGSAGKDKVLVATTGRVRVKVDASHAPIQIGDLLVTSDREGVAMKSEALIIQGRSFHSPGTIIGKALEPLEKGTGEILVLLSLQ